jgi:hypothetical protein
MDVASTSAMLFIASEKKKKMSYADLATEAILALRERSNGSSLQAIKKYLNIEGRQSRFLNSALKAGVKKGAFVKVKGSYKVAVKRSTAKHTASNRSGNNTGKSSTFTLQPNLAAAHYKPTLITNPDAWDQFSYDNGGNGDGSNDNPLRYVPAYVQLCTSRRPHSPVPSPSII